MPNQQFTVTKKRGRRAPSYSKRSGVFAAPANFVLNASGQTRDSVMQAAEIFAAQARKNAAKFSTRIPAATGVQAIEEQQAMVVTDGTAAPNAAPFEFGERHPLNYPNQTKTLARSGRARWWAPQGKPPKPRRRPYMDRAATNKKTIDQAAEIYAQLERDLLAEEYGYTD